LTQTVETFKFYGLKRVANTSNPTNVSNTNGNILYFVQSNLTTIQSKSNGKEVYMQYGAFNNSYCGSGFIYLFDIINNTRYEGRCNSACGLSYSRTNYAIFRITGNNCASSCNGYIDLFYTPPLCNKGQNGCNGCNVPGDTESKRASNWWNK
jgi:hypothetical protein